MLSHGLQGLLSQPSGLAFEPFSFPETQSFYISLGNPRRPVTQPTDSYRVQHTGWAVFLFNGHPRNALKSPYKDY